MSNLKKNNIEEGFSIIGLIIRISKSVLIVYVAL